MERSLIAEAKRADDMGVVSAADMVVVVEDCSRGRAFVVAVFYEQE